MKTKKIIKKKSWYDIFGYTQQDIDRMRGDIECDMAVQIMEELIENYKPPKKK